MSENKSFKTLKKTLIISLILTLSTLALCFVHSSMRKSLINSIIVIFVSFNITIFTGVYISKKVKNIFYGLVLSILCSIILIYLFDFLIFDFLFLNSHENDQSIKNIAILGVLVSILSFLFGIYKKGKQEIVFQKLNYPIVKSLLFSSFIVFTYAIIFIVLFEGTALGSLKFYIIFYLSIF